MTKKMPPVPPAGRNRQPGHEVAPEVEKEQQPDKKQRNLEQQGRQGNISQNTRHQGFQQDR